MLGALLPLLLLEISSGNRLLFVGDFLPWIDPGYFFIQVDAALGSTRGWPHLHFGAYTFIAAACLPAYLSGDDPERLTLHYCCRRSSLSPVSSGSSLH